MPEAGPEAAAANVVRAVSRSAIDAMVVTVAPGKEGIEAGVDPRTTVMFAAG